MSELSSDSNKQREARLERLDTVAAEEKGRQGPLVDWYTNWRSRMEILGGDPSEQLRFEFITVGLDTYLAAREASVLNTGIDALAIMAAYEAAELRYTELTGNSARTFEGELLPDYDQLLKDSYMRGPNDFTVDSLRAVCNLQLKADQPLAG